MIFCVLAVVNTKQDETLYSSSWSSSSTLEIITVKNVFCLEPNDADDDVDDEAYGEADQVCPSSVLHNRVFGSMRGLSATAELIVTITFTAHLIASAKYITVYLEIMHDEIFHFEIFYNFMKILK